MPEESLKESKRDISHFSNVQYDKGAMPQYDNVLNLSPSLCDAFKHIIFQL